MATHWFNGDDRLEADDMVLPAIITFVGWSIFTLIVLLSFSVFTLEGYFILVFIGLLATTQVFAPVQSRPQWWVALRLLVLAGYIVFALILFHRISEILF